MKHDKKIKMKVRRTQRKSERNWAMRFPFFNTSGTNHGDLGYVAGVSAVLRIGLRRMRTRL